MLLRTLGGKHLQCYSTQLITSLREHDEKSSCSLVVTERGLPRDLNFLTGATTNSYYFVVAAVLVGEL
ncbi:hypothetical protein MLPF_3323 [Mycobacterium lepromatosis]|nr:hypothetical protein MLPF_3323 [Mycobacterium lepromatosis]